MSNAIIKQQGDSPIVADNLFQIRLGAGSFILGALAGTLVSAAVGRLTARVMRGRSRRLRAGWPINFAHRGGAKVVPEDTLEGFREGFAMGGRVVGATYTHPRRAPSSSFMMPLLTGQPMAQARG